MTADSRLGGLPLAQRLEQWLGDGYKFAAERSVTDVLLAPWEHLAHNGRGAPNVRSQELKKIQSAGGSEERVRLDYRGRYAIELLQNAHDACADAETVGAAWLQVTDTALLVGNQGQPFDAERIDSLLQLGDSSKVAGLARHHTIGYKGIGFSAVLEISDSPQVISEHFAFGFHREAASAVVGMLLGAAPSKIAVRSYPFPLEPQDWQQDADAVDALLAAGAITVVRVPFKNPGKAASIAAEVATAITAETLLFMPHLKSVSVQTPLELRQWSRHAGQALKAGQVQHLRQRGKPTSSWLVSTTTVRVRKEDVEALEDPLWKDVRQLNVSVAMPWKGGAPDPGRPGQSLHVYFPTDEALGRSLLVHGDFYVQSNRRRITAADGRGGNLSAKVSEAAVELVAKMAEALAEHGNTLLRTLAPVAEPDGYGRAFAELLDARLARAAILRPADGSRAMRPGDLRRLGVDLPTRHQQLLTSLLVPNKDLMCAGDDDGCRAWLARLGCANLPPVEVAKRISPQDRHPYQAVLSVVSSWYGTLTGPIQGTLRKALRERPVLQNTHGEWERPDGLTRIDSRTPGLPEVLRGPVYAPPKNRIVRDFAETVLGVELIDAAAALDRVLGLAEREGANLSGATIKECLEFLAALWRLQPQLLRTTASRPRLAHIRVPTHPSGRPTPDGYRKAGEVYLAKDWSDSDLLARLYGPFQESEFLAVKAPKLPKDRARERQFWLALGVADEPRRVSVATLVATPSHWTTSLWKWQETEVIKAAMVCPDGHPQSPRAFAGADVMDRLEQLLAREEPRTRWALAQHLLALGDPLGGDVKVSCQHSSHKRGRSRSAPGFQDWLLRTRVWVPAAGGAAREDFRAPEQTWSDVPKGAARQVLATSKIVVKNPAAVAMPSVNNAPLRGLVRALREAQTAWPDLMKAPAEALEGCHWLLKRIDTIATRSSQLPHTDQQQGAPLLLPCMIDGLPAWSAAPLVADLPGAESVPGIAWLPSGPWAGLQRLLGIERATRVVHPEVRDEPAGNGAPALLSRTDKEQLLALLMSRGGEVGRLAARLGHLEERRVLDVRVVYSIRGKQWDDRPRVHLQHKHDQRGGVRGALLRTHVELDDTDHLEIAQRLASYLHADDSVDLIAMFLILRDKVVKLHGLVPSQLAEAAEALRRYRTEEVVHQTSPEGATSPSEVSTAGSEQDSSVPLGADGTTPERRDSEPATSRGTHVAPTSGTDRKAPVGDGRPQRSDNDSDDPHSRRPEVDLPATPASFGTSQYSEPHPMRRRPPPGGRPGSGDRPGSGTSGEAPADLAADRRQTELTAEKVATDYLTSKLNARVLHVAHENQGWDLTAELPDGTKLLVEVKGFSDRSNSFMITRNELHVAQKEPEYRICIVSGTKHGHGEISWIEDVAALLTDERLEPFQWIVLDWPSVAAWNSQWSL